MIDSHIANRRSRTYSEPFISQDFRKHFYFAIMSELASPYFTSFDGIMKWKIAEGIAETMDGLILKNRNNHIPLQIHEKSSNSVPLGEGSFTPFHRHRKRVFETSQIPCLCIDVYLILPIIKAMFLQNYIGWTTGPFSSIS